MQLSRSYLVIIIRSSCHYFLQETSSKAVEAGLPSGTQHAASESNNERLVHLLRETLDELKGH